MIEIPVPAVIWALGDREPQTIGGVTITTRPIYYRAEGRPGYVRVGRIDPDYAEVLMDALTKGSG